MNPPILHKNPALQRPDIMQFGQMPHKKIQRKHQNTQHKAENKKKCCPRVSCLRSQPATHVPALQDPEIGPADSNNMKYPEEASLGSAGAWERDAAHLTSAKRAGLPKYCLGPARHCLPLPVNLPLQAAGGGGFSGCGPEFAPPDPPGFSPVWTCHTNTHRKQKRNPTLSASFLSPVTTYHACAY